MLNSSGGAWSRGTEIAGRPCAPAENTAVLAGPHRGVPGQDRAHQGARHQVTPLILRKTEARLPGALVRTEQRIVTKRSRSESSPSSLM